MPPTIVIADSDEDDDYSPPQSPEPARPVEPDTAQLLDHVSHATSSTDPAFFQNVYDEQNDAAREFAGDGVTSSEITAPAPFQRTVTGFYGPSSTSVTDPAAPRERPSSGRDANEWTQVSTPDRKKAPPAMASNDLWDVPSSPDNGREPLVSRTHLKQTKSKPSANSRTTAGQLDHDPSAPYEQAHAGSPIGSRKRRRIEDSQAVTIPHTNDLENPRPTAGAPATSEMLPPTLPIGSDTSFYVATKPLTESQKMQYHAVPLASSNGPNRDLLPPMYHGEGQYQGSSGTATNVNTPRSEYPSLRTPSIAPQASDSATTAMARRERSPYQQPDSSPDIITITDSPVRPKKKAKREPRRDSSAAIVGVGDVSEVEGTPSGAEPHSVNLSANNGDAEERREPIKSKKMRGRPKKQPPNEEAQLTNPTQSHGETGEPATKQKKKRGRPRKSEQPAPAAASTRAESLSTGEDAGIKERAAEVEAEADLDQQQSKPEGKAGQEVEKYEGQITDGNQVETQTSPVHGADDGYEKTNLKERNRNSIISNKDVKTKVPPSDDLEATAAAGREETAATSTGAATNNKGAGQNRGSSLTPGSASKPLFRVGLSKKSRIAPLLKCLRK